MKPVKEEKKIKGENNIYVQDKNGEQTKVAKKSKKTTKTRKEMIPWRTLNLKFQEKKRRKKCYDNILQMKTKNKLNF